MTTPCFGMARVLTVFCIGLLASACGAATDDDMDEERAATTEALQSPGLANADMVPVKTPRGMPEVWDQPDSTGVFEERGKCGPTAVANLLKLYGKEVSPAQADKDGVNWLVGTRGINVRDYLQRKHPSLGCTLEHPEDGAAFLRRELDAGHPVMVWFNTSGLLQSHWVTVVGHLGAGANEIAIVMSWGRYYKVAMPKLVEAWENVYWIRHPSIVCDAKTNYIVR